MTVRQKEACGAVIKLGAQPGVKRMARFAVCRKLACSVVGILGLLIIGEMAGGALRRETLILTNSGAPMTVLALNRRMRTKQWKTILVVLDLGDGNLPAQHRMALCAICTEFPSVKVGAAVGTIPAHIGEDGFHVACGALHFVVHSAQWVVGLIVVEFRHGANRPPGCRCVAIFAGDGERAVRTLRVTLLRKKFRNEQNQPEREQQPDADLWYA